MTKLQKLCSYLIAECLLCVWAGSSIALSPVAPAKQLPALPGLLQVEIVDPPNLAKQALGKGENAIALQQKLVDLLKKQYPDDGLSSKPKAVREAERKLKELKREQKKQEREARKLREKAGKIPKIENPDKVHKEFAKLLKAVENIANSVWDMFDIVKAGARKMGDKGLADEVEMLAEDGQADVKKIADQARQQRQNIEPPKNPKQDPKNILIARQDIENMLKQGGLGKNVKKALQQALQKAPPGVKNILVKLPFQHIDLMELLKAIKNYRVQQRIKEEMAKRQLGQPPLTPQEKLKIEEKVEREIANMLWQEALLSDLIYQGERARQQMVGAHHQIEMALKNLANSTTLQEAFKQFIKRVEDGVGFEKALAELEKQVDPADKQQWESIKKQLQIYYASKKKFEEITVLLLLLRNPDFPLKEKTELYKGMVYEGGNLGSYPKYVGPEAEKQKKIVQDVYKDGVYQGLPDQKPLYDIYEGGLGQSPIYLKRLEDEYNKDKVYQRWHTDPDLDKRIEDIRGQIPQPPPAPPLPPGP